jgi:hypothetical protein
VSRSRQIIKNTTSDDIFVTIELWAWRYRLKPGDVFEIKFSLELRNKDLAPLQIRVGMEGNKIGLIIFVEGQGEPELLLNGCEAVEDYDLR